MDSIIALPIYPFSCYCFVDATVDAENRPRVSTWADVWRREPLVCPQVQDGDEQEQRVKGRLVDMSPGIAKERTRVQDTLAGPIAIAAHPRGQHIPRHVGLRVRGLPAAQGIYVPKRDIPEYGDEVKVAPSAGFVRILRGVEWSFEP